MGNGRTKNLEALYQKIKDGEYIIIYSGSVKATAMKTIQTAIKDIEDLEERIAIIEEKDG